ncbi:hypothetical protein AAY473_033614 [Plecturocebus cupreus]
MNFQKWLHGVPSSERALNLSPALDCDHSDVQSFTGMGPKKRSQVNDVHFIACTLTGSAFLRGLLLVLVAKRLLLQPYKLISTSTVQQLANYSSQHIGRLRWADHLRSGVQDQPGQRGETSSLLKIQKLAGHGSACLQSQLLRTLRQENCLNPEGGGGSEPRLCHCPPAWHKPQLDNIFGLSEVSIYTLTHSPE